MPKEAGKPGQANHFTTVSNKVLLAVSNGTESRLDVNLIKEFQEEDQTSRRSSGSAAHVRMIKSTNVGFRLNELLQYE